MIEQFIYSYLVSLSLPFGNRVFPLVAPSGAALPLVTYQVITDVIDSDLLGNTSYRRPRVQLSLYSATMIELIALREQLIDAIRTNAFPVQAGIQTINILSTLMLKDSAAGLYRCIVEFQVFYNDSIVN